MPVSLNQTGAIVVTTNDKKRVAFVGQPNTGKSTFFNRITKAGAGVANWPGLTVDLMQADLPIDGESVEFVDLPGIYDLDGFTEDEAVVQNFLQNYAIDLIVIVINASQIDRQVRMPLQVKALGLPAMVVLNMADEVRRFGVHIDTLQLSQNLGMPVYTISAKYGSGCNAAIEGIHKALVEAESSYKVVDLVAHLGRSPVTEEDLSQAIERGVTMPDPGLVTLTNRLDAVLLHPVFGLPIFFLSMLAIFMSIWFIGIPAQDPVSTFTDWFQSAALQPALKFLPQIVQDFILNGPYAGFAALLGFVPLVAFFFVVMTALEDSGYLSRAAYLMDATMRKAGLDGRGFVMQLFGFGCNVPAIMGTRTIRSRSQRLLSILVIPFALCSARLQVFVFFLGIILPGPSGAVALWLLYLISFAVAFIIAAIFNLSGQFKSKDPFVIELPPYRTPTFAQVGLNVWHEMKTFVQKLSVFMIIGTTLTWFLTNYPGGAEGMQTYAGQIGSIFQPLMQPLGINPLLTVSLIIGFVAKEVQLAAVATMYGMADGSGALTQKLGSVLDFGKGFSYCLFSLLYVPCLTTVATIWGETKSTRFTLLSIGVSMITAWVVAFLFYQGWILFAG
ncbi:MAG: ferrous iron transport protein B [Prochlorococcus sp.]